MTGDIYQNQKIGIIIILTQKSVHELIITIGFITIYRFIFEKASFSKVFTPRCVNTRLMVCIKSEGGDSVRYGKFD